MFHSESDFQKHLHENPEIILSGIPEINPQYCPDTPSIISLGREIPLNSGMIDNLYIDTNSIITFVECKLYSNQNIKREVYSQAINYASDLQNMLSHFTGIQFCEEFFKILRKAQSFKYKSFDEIINYLSEDGILGGKKIKDWKEQFIQRLEYNIKFGVCRIIIACAPSSKNIFSYSAIRNLIQLMSFSEVQNNRYDLILLDIREENESFISKIIWRRYAYLPQIPLIAQATKDTSRGIEKMKNKYSNLPAQEKTRFNELIEYLNNNGIYLVENTQGYALYSEKNKKSLYVLISIEEGYWQIIRHQIRKPEKLFSTIMANELNNLLSEIKYNVITKRSGQVDPMYDIEIEPDTETQIDKIGQCIINVLAV